MHTRIVDRTLNASEMNAIVEGKFRSPQLLGWGLEKTEDAENAKKPRPDDATMRKILHSHCGYFSP